MKLTVRSIHQARNTILISHATTARGVERIMGRRPEGTGAYRTEIVDEYGNQYSLEYTNPSFTENDSEAYLQRLNGNLL